MLVWGCDGGDVGDDSPQLPFVGPGSAPLPSLLSWSCLLPLLCGQNVPASGERENPSLSPARRLRYLFRVYFVLLRPFLMGMGGAVLVCGGWEVRCFWCVVYCWCCCGCPISGAVS